MFRIKQHVPVTKPQSGLFRLARAMMLFAASALPGIAAAQAASPGGARAAMASATALPPGSIDELQSVEIGGIRQWISVRGTNPDNPILLFVHGGPGSPMMAESWTFQRPWEDYFTVVQWDQRGSGKTFSSADRNTDQPLSVELMVKDGEALVEYLVKKYHKRKIILMGHSWGSVLALSVALRHPELIYAYVGVGQVVNMRRNEAEGYRLTLEEARRQKNAAAVAELQAIAPYPEPDGTIPIAKTVQERKWDVALRGMVYASVADEEEGRRKLSPLYDDHDVESADLGTRYSAVSLWPTLSNVSFDDVKSVPFPLLIFGGAHDRTTPTSLSRQFFDQVKAPFKRYFLVDKAAHYVVNEAPGEVLLDLVQYVRPLARDADASQGARSGH